MAASLLDSAISAAVADVDQFDVLDELDLTEAMAILPTDEGRSKRGIDGKCITSCKDVKLQSRIYLLQMISSML